MVTVVFSAVQCCSRVTVVFDDESSVQQYSVAFNGDSGIQLCSAVAVVLSGDSGVQCCSVVFKSDSGVR